MLARISAHAALLLVCGCASSSEMSFATVPTHVGLGRPDAVGEKPAAHDRHRVVGKLDATMSKGQGCYTNAMFSRCFKHEMTEAVLHRAAGAAIQGAPGRTIRGVVIDATVKDLGVTNSYKFEVRGEVVEPASAGEPAP